MLNTIVIDKNENSRELICSYLKGFEDAVLFASAADFCEACNLDEVHLIIFDVDSNNIDNTILKIKEIKSKFPAIEFIATSYEINSSLVSRVLKEDVKDFLLKPVIAPILESAVKKVQNAKKGVELLRANTICVYSNKAGSGKTSLAVNLAYELAQNTEKKVCLLDLTFNPEDISTFLNMSFNNNAQVVLSELKNQNDKTMFNYINRYGSSNLYVFSFKEEFNLSSKFDTVSVSKIINSLKNIFNYIIIDSSSTLDETTISILNNSDLILLLGLMNLASIRNCQKCCELFDNLNYNKNKTKLIVNRFIENSEISLEDMQQTIGADVFYKIPNNYLTLIDAINLGKTVIETNPQSNIAKAYKNLAREVASLDFLSLGEDNKKANYNHGIYNLLRRMGE